MEEKLEQEVRLLQLDIRHRYTLVISGRLTAKDCDLPKTPPNTKWSHKKYADWSQRSIKLNVLVATDQYPELKEEGRRRAKAYFPQYTLTASTGERFTMEFTVFEGI